MNMATRVMIIEDDIAIAELHHKYLSQLAGLVWLALQRRD